MEELRVSKLLAGGLAAISGAVVASRIGVEGTLTGAALTSMFVAVATALYSHSQTLAHGRMRRLLVRRAGGDADTGQPSARPIRWQRVAVAAAVIFVIAVGAITAVEAVAGQPLASLFGNRPRPGASTSIGVVASGQRGRPRRQPRRRARPPPRDRGRRRPRQRRSALPPRPCQPRRCPTPPPWPQPPPARRFRPPRGAEAGSGRPVPAPVFKLCFRGSEPFVVDFDLGTACATTHRGSPRSAGVAVVLAVGVPCRAWT